MKYILVNYSDLKEAIKLAEEFETQSGRSLTSLKISVSDCDNEFALECNPMVEELEGHIVLFDAMTREIFKLK